MKVLLILLVLLSSLTGTHGFLSRVTVPKSLTLWAKKGLYHDTADSIAEKLLARGWSETKGLIENRSAPVKQLPGNEVALSVRVFTKDSMYARVALLETLDANNENPIQTHHIQVLNAVIFPDLKTDVPVWGADLVRLPPDKDLILLDAQPIAESASHNLLWQSWYDGYEIEQLFPYGGDMPIAVQRFVSEYALWTRLQDIEDPTYLIQTELLDALDEHLNIYLRLVDKNLEPKANRAADYLTYRRENDPAKPMLKALYGQEYTDKLLQILFPDTLLY